MTDYKDNWANYLDAAVFAINTSVQGTTKISPFKMMYGGREPRFPLEAERELERIDINEVFQSIKDADVDDVMESICSKQEDLFSLADDNIKKSQEKQVKNYRKRRGIVEYDIIL